MGPSNKVPNSIILRIKNFKSLRNETSIELKPITILIGSNSSGKSSIIQFLLLIKQTLENRTLGVPLIFHGNIINLESFKNIIYKKGRVSANTLSFSFQISDQLLKVSVKYSSYTDTIYISELIYKDMSKKKELSDFKETKPVFRRSRYLRTRGDYITKIKIKRTSFEPPFFKVSTNKTLINKLLNFKLGKSKIEDLKSFDNIQNSLFRALPELINCFPITILRIAENTGLIDYFDFESDEIRDISGFIREFKKCITLNEKEKKEALSFLSNLVSDLTLYKTGFVLLPGWDEGLTKFNLRKHMRYKEPKDNILFWKFLISDILDSVIGNSWNRIELLEENLLDIMRHLFYIGPLRADPRRIYFSPEYIPMDVGKKGEYSIHVYSRLSDKEQNKIIKWLEKFELAKNVKAREIKGKTLKELRITEYHTGCEVNIADIGFGVSQIFPLIVQTIASPESSIILSEQPEIHLNPKIQSKIADFIVNFHKEKSFIIETHSEHLLLRLQRNIAKGLISPEDISIYYFHLSKENTEIIDIGIRDDGVFEKWPTRFFEDFLLERVKLTEDMIKVGEKNGNGDRH